MKFKTIINLKIQSNFNKFFEKNILKKFVSSYLPTSRKQLSKKIKKS